MTNTAQLRSEFSDLLIESFGPDSEFSHTQSFEAASSDSLIFIQSEDQLNPHAAAVITTLDVAQTIQDKFTGFIGCVEDVRLAQALIKQAYDDYDWHDSAWPARHPSAVIHPSAHLADTVRIGPGVVIGENVTLDAHVVIRANSVVESNVSIGGASVVNANCVIGYGSQIGKRVIIRSGSAIASEGFGFAKTIDNAYVRIPHTGNVVIEDDVVVGSNCCVDRGTYGSTLIRRGVKIDNLCHIAHNVVLEEDCLLVAQTGIAGSSTLGKRVIASGQTGILDHKKVADDAVLIHRAGVIEDIPSGGLWGGLPARPFREHMRRYNLESLFNKKIKKLEARIQQLEAAQSKPTES